MSSEPQESSTGVEQDGAAENADSPGLTIALPDGCESVSDAIVTNREMLREPGEHGLATSEEITHLSEAIESLSGSVEEVSAQYEEGRSVVDELRETVDQQRQRIEDRESEVAELRATVERQREQIEELQSMVTQLMDILGTDAEWESFED